MFPRTNGGSDIKMDMPSHVECCLVFTRGYSYQSKYQGLKNYAFFMRNSAPQEDQIEFSFELNKHNKTLLAQIQNAGESASALQRYPRFVFGDACTADERQKAVGEEACRWIIGW